ncbi:MAG: hypothetical protein HY858_10915 [Candidatus Solibacter usitatus]|nr:hypothetical protein [Candidatus Solibacter usitatus]
MPRLGLVPLAALVLSLAPVSAQKYQLRSAPAREILTLVDGNSPAVVREGRFSYFTSTGMEPVVLRGADQFSLSGPTGVVVEPRDHYPIWIESVWLDGGGTLYGWYHHEDFSVCGPGIAVPQIGAVVSYDGGDHFQDLGLVLASGGPPDCHAGNALFAGGHGDFSVILDRDSRYFYFLFTNYAGPLAEQGVAIARLKFEDRHRPAGAAFKYFNGMWSEPGLGGRVSPIFPARVNWRDSGTDSFWGPAIHWNSYLESYVVLLNRACCAPRWPQEGIYISANADLADPAGWLSPSRLMSAAEIGYGPGYYPQVLGLGPGETDTLAGQTVRLYIHGRSFWELTFLPPGPDDNGVPEEPPPPTEPQPSESIRAIRRPPAPSTIPIASPAIGKPAPLRSDR